MAEAEPGVFRIGPHRERGAEFGFGGAEVARAEKAVAETQAGFEQRRIARNGIAKTGVGRLVFARRAELRAEHARFRRRIRRCGWDAAQQFPCLGVTFANPKTRRDPRSERGLFDGEAIQCRDGRADRRVVCGRACHVEAEQQLLVAFPGRRVDRSLIDRPQRVGEPSALQQRAYLIDELIEGGDGVQNRSEASAAHPVLRTTTHRAAHYRRLPPGMTTAGSSAHKPSLRTS
ncbi:MAG TPA: hypothetical protein VF132_13745 [Rudaea sp.]